MSPRQGCVDPSHPHVWAVSDLHGNHNENRAVVDSLRPVHPNDWLLVAGDVSESSLRTMEVLRGLRERFSRVVWTPGNHELWTHPQDDDQSRGSARYERLVRACRDVDVITPEDPYPIWEGAGDDVFVVPVHLLYDYSFRDPSLGLKAALQAAWDEGHVFSDEMLLHPDPFPTRADWCRARVTATETRLAELDPAVPLTVVNHYPLVEEPTRQMFSPHLPLWCGTRLTAEWHLRFPIRTVVHGHLHIPRSSVLDGVAYEEVSLGYPREWRRRATTFAARSVMCGRHA